MIDDMSISKGRDSVYQMLYALANDATLLDRMQKALGITAAAVPAPLGKPQIKTKIIGDLEWQEEVPDRQFTWGRAKEYAASLGDGWRLPTIKELRTLVDYEKYKPACSVFPDCPSDWFWSSSEFCSDATSTWCANFYYGAVSGREMHDHYRVRCVRDVKGVG